MSKVKDDIITSLWNIICEVERMHSMFEEGFSYCPKTNAECAKRLNLPIKTDGCSLFIEKPKVEVLRNLFLDSGVAGSRGSAIEFIFFKEDEEVKAVTKEFFENNYTTLKCTEEYEYQFAVQSKNYEQAIIMGYYTDKEAADKITDKYINCTRLEWTKRLRNAKTPELYNKIN